MRALAGEEEERAWSSDIGPCIECGGPSWLWRGAERGPLQQGCGAGKSALGPPTKQRFCEAKGTYLPSAALGGTAASPIRGSFAVAPSGEENITGEDSSTIMEIGRKVDLLAAQVTSCLQGLEGLPSRVVDEWAEAVESDLRSASKLSLGRHSALRSFGMTDSHLTTGRLSAEKAIPACMQARLRSFSALGSLEPPLEEPVGNGTPCTPLPNPEASKETAPTQVPQRSLRSLRSLGTFRSLGRERSFKSFVSFQSPESLRSIRSLKSLLKRPRRPFVVQALWNFFEEPNSGRAASLFHRAWAPFIFLTVAATLLQSLSPEPLVTGCSSWAMETAFDAIFATECLLRLVASPNVPAFLRSFSGVVDLLAALPLLARLLLGPEALPKVGQPPGSREEQLAQALLCFSPSLRLLKTLRRFQQYHLFVAILSFTQEALQFLLLALVMMVLLFSSLIYFAEQAVNGDLNTLTDAMWLTVVTLTTVGYGDVTPMTPAGQLICFVLILGSVLFMAMPIGIIGNAFTEKWKDRDRIMMNRRFQDRILQCGYTVQDVVPMFAQFDLDCNGELSLSEFVEMVREMQLGLHDDSAIQIFEMIDKNGSGGIDCREFVREFFPSTFFHEIYGHGWSPGEWVKEKVRARKEQFAAHYHARRRNRRRGSGGHDDHPPVRGDLSSLATASSPLSCSSEPEARSAERSHDSHWQQQVVRELGAASGALGGTNKG